MKGKNNASRDASRPQLGNEKKAKLVQLPTRKGVDGKSNSEDGSNGNDTLVSIVNVGDLYSKDAELIVPTTHTVFVIRNGILSLPMPEGRHRLFNTKKVLLWKKCIDDDIKVVFISKTAVLKALWGTPASQRIKYVDPKLSIPIEVGAYGSYEFKVTDPRQFYLEVVANFGDDFSISDLSSRINSKTADRITDCVRRVIQREQMSYYDFESKKTEMQQELRASLRDEFASTLGITVCDFVFESINIGDEELKQLAGKYRRSADEQEYEENRAIQKKHAQDAREDAREQREWDLEQDDWKKEDVMRELKFRQKISKDENDIYERERDRRRDEENYQRKNKLEDEDRAHAKEMDLLSKKGELAEAALRYDAVKSAGWEGTPRVISEPNSSGGKYCRCCGHSYEIGDMYCPNCGAVTDNNASVRLCPSCNKETSVKNKFCPHCGAAIN